MNPLLLEHPLVARLGWTLLHFVWQGAALGIVAGIVLHFARRRPAAIRYNLALTFFILLAVAPVVTFCAVRVSSTGTIDVASGSPIPADIEAELLRLQATAPRPAAERPEVDSIAAEVASSGPLQEAVDLVPPQVPMSDLVPGMPLSRSPTASPQSSSLSTIVPLALPWIVAAWLCGVVVLSLRLCGGWWWTRRLLTRGARPLAADWLTTIDRLRRRLDVGRAVRCVESASATVPLVIGWLRPVVVVPASILSGLAPHEVECLLAHELAHIRRHDYLINLGQCVVEVLLFYHPVVWWLSRRVRHERECVCDELGIGATGDRLVYSRALLGAAEIAVRTPGIAVAATQGDLTLRVHAILGRAAPSGRASGWVVLLLTALLLSAVVAVRPNELPGSPVVAAEDDTPQTDGASASETGKDLYGDPLPEGALVRLGTVRYRQAGGRATVIFLPDGNTALVGPGLLRLVDLPTGRTIGKLPFDRHPVNLLMAGSPDGSRVVLIGSQFIEARLDHVYSATVWDVQSASELGHIEWQNRDGGEPKSACLSADGSILAIGDGKGLVRVFDAEAGLEAKSQRFAANEISSLAISRDGSRLAVVTRQDGVWLWEWLSDKLPTQLPGVMDRPIDVQFSPDGRLLAACKDLYGAIHLWDARDGHLIRRMTMTGQGLTTRRIAFRPNSSEIAAICYSTAQVHFWNVETGEIVRTIETECGSPDGLAISPDGHWLVVTGFEREIAVWDLTLGKQLGREYQGHRNPPGTILFTPDGESVVTAGPDHSVGVWDVQSGKLLHRLSHIKRVHDWVGGIAVSPDGRLIASSAYDDTVGIWERETGRRLFTLAGHGTVGSRGIVQFTPDGQRLLSWGSDLFLRVFDVRTGKAVIENLILPDGLELQVDEETGGVRGFSDDPLSLSSLSAVGFSHDGRSLLLGTSGTLHVYDVETGREVRTFPAAVGTFGALRSPNGELLAVVARGPIEQTPLASGATRVSASRQQLLQLVRATDGAIMREMALPDGFSHYQAFSADGQLIAVAVAGADRRVQIFDVSNGKMTAEIVIDTPAILDVAFSPDARFLATSLDDTSVVLWEIESFSAPAQ